MGSGGLGGPGLASGRGAAVGRGRAEPERCRVGGLERRSEPGHSEMCSPNSGAAGEGRSQKERGAGGAPLRLK